MLVNCESSADTRCTDAIEISDIIDPKNNEEFIQALQEIREQGWYVDMGNDPHDVRFFCAEHGEPIKMNKDFDAIVKSLEA